MPIAADEVVIETGDWSPERLAVHREELGRGSSMVRHPGYPFVANVRDDGNELAPLLRKVAAHYLARFPQTASLGLGGTAGTAGPQPTFGWLALTWGGTLEGSVVDPRRSFWVRRRLAGMLADRSAVLLAANLARNGVDSVSLGASVGLRVVLHVGLPQSGRSVVRIGGHSTSSLHEAAVADDAVTAQVFARLQAQALPVGGSRLQPEQDMLLVVQSLLQGLVRRAFDFDQQPALTGLLPRIGVEGHLRLAGVGRRGGDVPNARFFAWTGVVDAGAGGLRPLTLIEQRTHMAGHATVLADDPASCGPVPTIDERGPTRRASRLQGYRKPTTLLPPAVAHRIVLADGRQSVVPTRVASGAQPAPPDPFEVPDKVGALRSDDHAARHAFVRARELFQRFDACGLDPDDYFRMARLPLRLHHRASFRFASDGKTVNAQVTPESQGQSLADDYVPHARPQLDVAFGCTDLAQREMHRNNTGRPRAQPMGLAADRRWAWHEFGHVLNFASTGELEFRFAHSAGDALAAIVADPDTDLSEPARVRHLTFPWVKLARSHGRPAERGWCWCGQRNGLRLARLDGPAPIPGGYFEEQLMSSSLFRFYRAIGGDTDARASERRRSASDYAVYLVMRAIELLGPATVVPARSVDQFVSALVDADTGTADWRVDAPWPDTEPVRHLHRVGGMVHKVLRWAFERQGLFATADPTAVQEGVGLPLAVDVYIPGRSQRHDGGYEPVALDWVWDAGLPAAWHADADSITTNGGGLLRVTVRNRGGQVALEVGARVWVTADDGAALGTWAALEPAAPGLTQDIGPQGTTTFAFVPQDGAGLPLSGDYFVFAAASCVDDRANTDPAAHLPGSDRGLWSDPSLLTDLVANDNNLGLRIVRF